MLFGLLRGEAQRGGIALELFAADKRQRHGVRRIRDQRVRRENIGCRVCLYADRLRTVNTVELIGDAPFVLRRIDLTCPVQPDAARFLVECSLKGGQLCNAGRDGRRTALKHVGRGDRNGIVFAGHQIFKGGGRRGDDLCLGIVVGAGERDGPAFRRVALVVPGQNDGGTGGGDGEAADDINSRNGRVGRGQDAAKARALRLLKLEGVFLAGLQICNGGGMTGEGGCDRLYAVGVVAYRPDAGIRAVERQIQLDL